MSFLVQLIYLLSLAIWLGGIVFFSFFTTPSLFQAFQSSKELAGQVLTLLFPRYYALGYITEGLMLFATLMESILQRQVPWIRILILLTMLGCTVYAGQVLLPQVHDLKIQIQAVDEHSEVSKDLKERFDRGHHFSVILNVIVLLSAVVLVTIVAYRLRL